MAFALTTRPKRTATGWTATACDRNAPLRRAVESSGPQRFTSKLNAKMAVTGPRIQTKLKIGEPKDKFEQEADRVANEIVRTPDREVQSLQQGAATIPGSLQRLCDGCEEELRKQPEKEDDAGEIADVGTDIESQVSALRNGGQPLPQSLLKFFEPRFGYDFNQVRLHTDARAATAAREVNAKAFTLGSSIVFGAGHYAPATSAGKHLLAHELTHVTQQDSKAHLHDRPSHADIQRAPDECPTLVSFTASGRDPYVSDKCKDDCRFELGCCTTERGSCGKSDTSGMVFKAVVKAEKNCEGELGFMQNLLSTNRKVKKSDGEDECIKAEKPHKDGGIPWKGCTVSVKGPGQFTITSDDCPNRKLNDNPASVSITESFKTFLLWKPEGTKTRKPIANVAWGWSGEISKAKGKDCADQFKVVSASHTDGKGTASTDSPVTSPEVKDLKAGPCK